MFLAFRIHAASVWGRQQFIRRVRAFFQVVALAGFLGRVPYRVGAVVVSAWADNEREGAALVAVAAIENVSCSGRHGHRPAHACPRMVMGMEI